MIASSKRPLVRMVKRAGYSPWFAFFVRVGALVLALAIGAVIVLTMGHSPLSVYRDMITGSLGSATAIKETVRLAVPLCVVALAISLSFRMRFWNIGAEGQVLFGAICATYFALFYAGSMPSWLLLIVMAVAGAIGGALWALPPALSKAKWGTNETLFTLMLNYVALCLVKYLQNGPWKDARLRGFPKIAMFEQAARLPKVFGVHAGWIAALVLVVAVFVYLRYTRHGYEITIVGESPRTASYAGMSVGRILVRTMAVSGALSGFVGFLQVSGADGTLTDATAGGVGFTAITVAWLSKLNPIAMVFVSLGIALMEKGANRIQTTQKIPASAAEVLTGVILFCMLGCEFFLQYRLIWRFEKEHAHGNVA